MTASEALFEAYCTANAIIFSRVPTEDAPTPDYRISLSDHEVICEVKEVTRNPYEKRLLTLPGELWGEEESVYTGGAPGSRLRKKISDGVPQIKGRGRER